MHCSRRVQKRQTSAVLDFQAPRKTEPKKSSVTLHNDRVMHFGQRSTPSMSGGDGILEPKASSSSAPVAITFKKRKLNTEHRKNFRRRDGGDD